MRWIPAHLMHRNRPRFHEHQRGPEREMVIGASLCVFGALVGRTFAVAVDAVLVVLVLEHLADEDLQPVLHLLLALLLHLGAAVAVVRRHPDAEGAREVFARALTTTEMTSTLFPLRRTEDRQTKGLENDKGMK